MHSAEGFCTTEETQKLLCDTSEWYNNHIKALLMFDKHGRAHLFLQIYPDAILVLVDSSSVCFPSRRGNNDESN